MKKATTLFTSVFLGLALILAPLSPALAAISLVVQSVAPSTTISPGTSVSFTVVASGFSSPIYRMSDSFSSNSGASIDSAGNFRWTPNSNDLGTHIFTITVTDSIGNVATAQQQIVVSNNGNSSGALSIQSLFPGSLVNLGQQVLFTAIAPGFVNPNYTVSDTFNGTSLRSNMINSNGNFNWTPQSQDIGTHVITVFATDSFSRSATTQTTITVSGNNQNTSGVIQGPFPSSNVQVGTQVTFSVPTSGFINPVNSVTDSRFGSSISNFNINSSGFFSWIPNTNDIGTHTLTVNTTDSFGRFRTLQTTITVFGSNGNFNNGSQSTLDLLEAQLASLKLQLAALIGSGSIFNNSNTSDFVSGLPSSTVPTATNGNGYIFTRFLQVGSSGDEVVELQQKLRVMGVYSGSVTGYFGSATQAALRRFQSQRGLSQTGTTDSQTLSALNQYWY